MNARNCISGLDGCKGGWFCISWLNNNKWSINLFSQIHDWKEFIKDFSVNLALIDIPIGLPGTQKRRCDREARKRLTRLRGSSVFPVPSRKAMYAETYLDACEINKEALGVKISKQAWNIGDRIREVDQFLQKYPEWIKKLRESHPEVAFWSLAGFVPMMNYKKTPEGIKERLKLLNTYEPLSNRIYEQALNTFPRKFLASDDIIDALCLAIMAKYSISLKTLPEFPDVDEAGLPMEIVYGHFR